MECDLCGRPGAEYDKDLGAICDYCKSENMVYTVVYTAHDNEEYQEEFTDLKKAQKYAKGLEERGFKNVSIN